MVSSISKIEDAINSIPEKKEKLRKSLESLQSYSSSLATFTLDWKDLEDHFSSVEKSIDERFKALKEKEKEIQNQEEEEEEEEEEEKEDHHPHDEAAAAAAAAAAEGEPTPRPELRSLCVNMDGKGLRAYISENRKDLVALREELAPAIRCAPDPAVLVLEAVQGFYPPNSNSNFKNKNKRKARDNEEDGETQINRRICINLLEKLHLVSPNIGPSVKERAKKLAFDWKSMIPKLGDNCLESLGFLNLIAAYALVSEFPTNQILELFISVSRRKQAVDLLKSLGLVDKLPELIQKLSKKGRQLDAVKFVYALNEVEKYPPVPLLKAYITESKKIAKEVREKGNHSARAQNEATAKELGALKSVLKAVEQYNLENEYPRVGLVKRITQLEHKKADKKRNVIAAATAAANIKPQQQEQQSNKRTRLSPTTSAAVMTANPYHHHHHHHQHPSMIHTQPQLGLADRAPYIGVPSSYDLASSTAYVHSHGIGAPSLAGSMLDHGRTRSPPPTSYYSSQSLLGTSSLYDRPITYNGYVPGLPPSYGSSLYP